MITEVEDYFTLIASQHVEINTIISTSADEFLQSIGNASVDYTKPTLILYNIDATLPMHKKRPLMDVRVYFSVVQKTAILRDGEKEFEVVQNCGRIMRQVLARIFNDYETGNQANCFVGYKPKEVILEKENEIQDGVFGMSAVLSLEKAESLQYNSEVWKSN